MVGVVSRPLRRSWCDSGDRCRFLDLTSLIGVPRGRRATREHHGAVALPRSSPFWVPQWRSRAKRKDGVMTRRLLVAGAVVALFAVAPVGRANRTMAAVFTVNSTVDAVDVSPGDGACATLGGRRTPRAAVQEANARPGADGVNLPAGTYVLAILGAGEDAAVTGDLDITDDLTITGAGAESTIVDGGHIDRVFHVVRRLEG